jgi:predicted nucleotidyltransferase
MSNSSLQIDYKNYEILKNILSKYPYRFYAYGSRVKGTAKKYSDLDICYYDIPRKEILDLNQDLKDSDLSFIVELVS